jgi:hypothetical protein
VTRLFKGWEAARKGGPEGERVLGQSGSRRCLSRHQSLHLLRCCEKNLVSKHVSFPKRESEGFRMDLSCEKNEVIILKNPFLGLGMWLI